MSLSKSVQKCQFCGVSKGIYSCPRCNRKYCSSYCYKSREHESCSEAFFKEWVQNTLQKESFDRAEKQKIMDILSKFKEESEELDEESIENRFSSLNLDNVGVSDIWKKLSEKEKIKFKSLLKDTNKLEAIVPVKQPWWTTQMLSLVAEMDSSEDNDECAARPPFPLNVKRVSEVTSAKPSDSIQFNLVNILYIYVFLSRFYNCDLRDFLEEVVDSLFILSPVLSEAKNYLKLVESVQDSIRLIAIKQPELPISFVKGIVNDVNKILLGPSNARPSTFVLCALNDMKMLLEELKLMCREKKDTNKELKKKLMLTAKKIEYYMCWSSEYENTLSEISSDLIVLMLPDLIPGKSEVQANKNVKIAKPLIEEIS